MKYKLVNLKNVKRIIHLIFFMCILKVQAFNWNQDKLVTLSFTDVPIETIFNEIENLTDFRFVYNHADLNPKKIVSAYANDEDVAEVIKALLLDTHLTFTTEDNKIIISLLDDLVAEESFQDKLIIGKVTDNEGNPLPGASVLAEGTIDLGTVTDFDGNYSLSVPESVTTIVISYVGYETQKIQINNRSVINVQLDVDSSELEEVVLIGYGSVTKKELTGSIANAENIENRAVTTVEEALQGNVAGVAVTSVGGDPTSTPIIKIRGVGTISPEQPLWVVDGVPYYGGSLNPFDIESVSVLKDAASAAIYGVRAAGGVILVTTKQGKSDDVKVDFSVFTGIQDVWNKPVALNAQQYTDAYNLAYDNSGSPRIDYFDPTITTYRLDNKTNWVDEIFQTGVIQNYDIALRGGTEKITFSSSLGYNTKEGILLNTYADRFSFRFNSKMKISDVLEVGQFLSFTQNNGQTVFTGTQAANGETNYNGIIAAAIKAAPFFPIYNEDGSYADASDMGQNGDVLHPVGTLERIDIDNPQQSLFSNLFIDYKPTSELVLKTSFGINQNNILYEEFQPRVDESSKVNSSTNRLIRITSKEIDWSWENTLNYTPEVGDKNSLQILAGYSLQKATSESNGIIATGFENEDRNLIAIPQAESIEDVTYFYGEATLLSYFSRVLYDYKKKYFLSASIRSDGTSKLSASNRREFYPSAAVSWRISEEEFFNSKFINNLKFRASWGTVGNIDSLVDFPTDVPLTNENIILGIDGFENATVLDGKSNPNLKWEQSETLNFGLDFNSEDNRVTLVADYFVRTTKDLLLRLPVSPLEGISTPPFVNAGEVVNKGLELNLGLNKNEGEFTYSLNGNISFIENEFTKLADGLTELPEGETQVATHFPLFHALGQPLYSFKLLETDGLLRTDQEVQEAVENGQPNAQLGDVKFVDQNGDQVIDDNDKIYHGSTFPKTTFGFNGNFNYKNFDLSVFIQGASGGVAYNGYKFTTTYPAHTSVAGANLSDVALDTWSPQNPDASHPRLSIDDPNGNIRESDFWLESTDYIRIKNLSLGYNFNSNKIYDSLRLYATAQNLATWTNYSGLDPEIGNRGLDGGQYPISRVFTLGVNLSL